MKIEIDRKEAEAILLEWAKTKWPDMNKVEWGHYNRPSEVIFTCEKEQAPE